MGFKNEVFKTLMFGASLAMIRHFDLLEAFPKVKSYLNI